MGRYCYVLFTGCHDVPIRRFGDVSLRRLGDFPWRRRLVFYLSRTDDVAETYRETLLRRRHDVLLPGWSLYRSPNQSYDNFVSFLDHFELTLDTLPQKNPFLLVALGDFNVKSSNLYNEDITSKKGEKRLGSNFIRWSTPRN